MALRAAEAWISDDGVIVAVKRKNGGYSYFVCGDSTVNREVLQDIPAVARRIANINFEIMEAKKNGQGL